MRELPAEMPCVWYLDLVGTHVNIHSCTQYFHNLLYKKLSSVQSLSLVRLSVPHGLQHARLPCPSPSPRVCSTSCPSSQ